jgi:hypothetical protein
MKNSNKGFGALIAILIVAILIGLGWYVLSQNKKVTNIQNPSSPADAQFEPNIDWSAFKQVIGSVGCSTTNTKKATILLSKDESLTFDYVICKTDGTTDYFMNDYVKFEVNNGAVLGYKTSTKTDKSDTLIKYWILNSPAEAEAVIDHEIKQGPDAVHCDFTTHAHENWFTEYKVKYNGPYTGNGVEPAENCGLLFGTGAGRKLIFSQRNVLMLVELGTENMFKFIPESVRVEKVIANTNLKKYSNKELGFSFSYPTEWILKTELNQKQPDKFGALFSADVAKKENFEAADRAYEGGFYHLDFTISVCDSVNTHCVLGDQPKVQSKSLADLVQTQLAKYKNSKNKPLVDDNGGYKTLHISDNLVVDGIQGYGVDEGGYFGHFQIMIENPKNKKVYLLEIPNSYLGCEERDSGCFAKPKISSQQMEILKSFKFE